MPPKPAQYTFPYLRKEQLSTDAYEFFFDRQQAQFSFLPGQYVRVTIPIENPDERGDSRLFSVTSALSDAKEISVITRVIQSTFKKTLISLPSKTPISIFGPLGRFVLDQSLNVPVVFLAGGIGMTPYVGMLRSFIEKSPVVPITLFASFTTPEEIILLSEMETIAKSIPSLRVVYTCTHLESSTTPWIGEVGRITDALIRKYVPDIVKPRYYISGPAGMVTAMNDLVQKMGVPQEQIKKELFTGY